MRESRFDGGLLQLIGWRLLGLLVTLCTLGIYSLWVGASGKQSTRILPLDTQRAEGYNVVTT